MRKVIVHLVDDNDIDIAVNTKLMKLAQIGDETRIYGDGSKFIEAIGDQRGELSQVWNIVLLDIMMPGMTGFETMEKFNQMDTSYIDNFDVFLISSTIDRNDIKRAEDTPRVHKILEKPLDVYFLKKLIEALQD